MPDATTLSTGSALYYPYIHPRNINHIKAALLYWDRVRRIVPEPFEATLLDDKDDARELAGHGLLVATSPEPYRERALQGFLAHIEPHSKTFSIDVETAHTLANSSKLASGNKGIHIEKLGGNAVQRLSELGLAKQIGDWVMMYDEVGAFYMFCLASEMGDQMKSPLFSDSLDTAALGQSLLFEPGKELLRTSSVLVSLGIELPGPNELSHVSTSKVVKFSAQRADERRIFREAIEGIVDIARSAHDDNALHDYLAKHCTAIQAALTSYRQTVDELRVGTIASLATKITVPAGIAAGIGMLSVSPAAAVILSAMGLVLGAVSVVAETRGKLRQAKTSTPYHYVVAIEKELLPR